MRAMTFFFFLYFTREMAKRLNFSPQLGIQATPESLCMYWTLT